MIAIKFDDYLKYGCPYCGCGSASAGNILCRGTSTGICRECRKEFITLSDGLTKSNIGFATDKVDKNGCTVYEYPKLQRHPRKGIPSHPWVQKDIKPEYGEYWTSRGIGYDLSGFVKSKVAGERLLQMVKDVLSTDNPKSWLDWREYEPEWIQFKFQKEEFDLYKLDKMCRSNNNIITKEILIECKV